MSCRCSSPAFAVPFLRGGVALALRPTYAPERPRGYLNISSGELGDAMFASEAMYLYQVYVRLGAMRCTSCPRA